MPSAPIIPLVILDEHDKIERNVEHGHSRHCQNTHAVSSDNRSVTRHVQELNRAGRRLSGLILLFLFFLSGSAGLIYETVWNRLLVLKMGNTAYALGAILTVFMGGLALGSWIGGRIAGRIKNPVRFYGILEIGIGLYCALVPYAIGAMTPMFGVIYRNFYGSFALFNLAQLIVCGIVLLMPVVLMGATLPIIAATVSRLDRRVSWPVGLVYGANTAGAFVGVMVGGFFLLPVLGIRSANLTGVGLNLCVGAAAMYLSTRQHWKRYQPIDTTEFQGQVAEVSTGTGADRTTASTIPVWLLLTGYGLSGLTAMVYQVAWTRIIVHSVGSAVYAFSLIVGAFILGLAIGAPIIGKLGDKTGWPIPLLIVSQFGLALAAALTIPALGALPLKIALLVSWHAESFARTEMAEFVAIFAIIVIPSFIMGGMLPLVSRLLAGSRDVGSAVGQAYAVNALGTIFGAIGTGFILIPVIGMQRSIGVGVTVNAVVGAAFLLAIPSVRLRWRTVAAGATIVFLAYVGFAQAPWDHRVTTSAPYLGKLSFDSGATTDTVKVLLANRQQPIFYQEDIVTTVTVVDETSGRNMYVAGKHAASDSNPTQSLLAHLPLLLHRQPRDVLIIGLGAGGTLDSTLRYKDVTLVDCIEISPAVRHAAVRFFHQDTRPFDDPRVTVRIGDGRHHLAMSGRRYDVIMSQPGNPWMVGSSSLFTQDAFLQLRDSLNPNGIAIVWMQGWMSPEAVRILLSTFGSVFEHMDIWEAGSPGHLFLTGYLKPTSFDPSVIEIRMRPPLIRQDLAHIAVLDAADLLGHFIADRVHAANLPGPTSISTDDLDRIGTISAHNLVTNRWIDVFTRLSDVRHSIETRLTKEASKSASVEFLVRSRRIQAAKKLIAKGMRMASKSAALARAGNSEEAQRLAKKAAALYQQAAELNSRPLPPSRD